MGKILRSNVRAHGRRYIATSLAILISMAFVLAALAFGEALNQNITRSITQKYTGVSAVIESDSGINENFVQRIRGVEGVAAVVPQYGGIMNFSLSGNRATTFVTSVNPKPLARPELAAGHLPEAENEVALSPETASLLDAKIGSQIHARVAYSENESVTSLHVVGILSEARFFASVSPVMTAEGLRALDPELHTHQAFVLAPSPLDSEGENALASAINSRVKSEAEVATAAHTVVSEQLSRSGVNSTMSTAMLLVFPAIALVVALIVVSTTFKVIVEQRRRELALLRCIGASGRQVRRLLLAEMLVVGFVSSLLGVGLGATLTSVGLIAGGLAASVGEALAAITPGSVIIVLVIGTLLTALAGLSPSRGATKISPLAALLQDTQATARKSHTRAAILGTLLALGGSAAIWDGTRKMREIPDNPSVEGFLLALAGSMLAFVAAIVLTSVVIPYFTRLVGGMFRSQLGRLAARNAVRNPGRTAATGTAVAIGVALIVTMLAGARSLSDTLTTEVDIHRPFDLTVNSDRGSISESELAKISSLSGVQAAGLIEESPVVLRHASDKWPDYSAETGEVEVNPDGSLPGAGTAVKEDSSASSVEPHTQSETADSSAGENFPDTTAPTTHSGVTIFAHAADNLARFAHSPISTPKAGEVFVSDLFARLQGKDAPVELCGVRECRTFKPVVTSWITNSDTVWLTHDDLHRLGSPHGRSTSVQVKLNDNASAGEMIRQIQNISPRLGAYGAAQEREQYTSAINSALLVVMALLGVSVLVALVGLANTLSLSVAERTRENGLLRALGLTKKQMMRMLAIESVLIALTAAMLGTGIGVLFGWIGLMSLPLNVEVLVVTIPWLEIIGVFLVAILAALLASILPGRRAAQVSPVEALATE